MTETPTIRFTRNRKIIAGVIIAVLVFPIPQVFNSYYENHFKQKCSSFWGAINQSYVNLQSAKTNVDFWNSYISFEGVLMEPLIGDMYDCLNEGRSHLFLDEEIALKAFRQSVAYWKEQVDSGYQIPPPPLPFQKTDATATCTKFGLIHPYLPNCTVFL